MENNIPRRPIPPRPPIKKDNTDSIAVAKPVPPRPIPPKPAAQPANQETNKPVPPKPPVKPEQENQNSKEKADLKKEEVQKPVKQEKQKPEKVKKEKKPANLKALFILMFILLFGASVASFVFAFIIK
jgi:hypothetical protein